MSLSAASQEALWVKHLLEDIGLSAQLPIQVNEDNQACISFSKDPRHHSRAKHIDTRYHFARDLVLDGVIGVQYCPTKEMVADVLTKAVPAEQHHCLLRLMGMSDSTDRHRVGVLKVLKIGDDDLREHADVVQESSIVSSPLCGHVTHAKPPGHCEIGTLSALAPTKRQLRVLSGA